MNDTYRKKFANKAKAQDYDDQQYSDHSYGSLIWNIELQLLQMILMDFCKSHSKIDYLDFASGTGRVISALESDVDSAVGIEISPEMVAVAQKKLKSGKMICSDITAPDAPIEGKYDLITAFRFFLNAEESLRRDVMIGLASRLKDETSLLIFNNHGNLYSHKIVMFPYHFVGRMGHGYMSEGNYMTSRQINKLATESGLVIEKVIGCGILSSKFLRVVSFEKLLAAETCLSRIHFLSRFGVNQMYLARKR